MKKKAMLIMSRTKKQPYIDHGAARGATTPYMRANARSLAMALLMFAAVDAAKDGFDGGANGAAARPPEGAMSNSAARVTEGSTVPATAEALNEGTAIGTGAG